MLAIQLHLGLVALLAVSGVAAQNSTTNSSSPSSIASPALILAGFPKCSQSCALTSLQTAQCSLASMSAMLDCFCTNINAQSELSMCATLNCDAYEAGVSMYLENAMCSAYPEESLSNVINNACIITFALAIPIVLARCVARWKLTGRLWADDYMSIAAACFLITLAVIQIACVQVGFGKHIWNFDWNNTTKLLKLNYAGQIVYIWAQIISKLSVLLLYRRVFNVGGSVWFRRALNFLIVYPVLHGLVYTFIIVFQCSPVSAAWDLAASSKSKCMDEGDIIFSGAIFSITEDVILILLPISELRKLQVSGRQRWGVAIMFAFASFGTIASIVRLTYILTTDRGIDVTWSDVNVVIWSLIENLMAVVCGSLPALRPYVAPWIPRIITWPRSRSSKRGSKKISNFAENAGNPESPEPYIADYKMASYPISSLTSNTTVSQWKDSHPVRQQMSDQADDLEMGRAHNHVEERSSSESGTDLIIQGR